MKFKCPECKKVFLRDLRKPQNKENLINGKYKSLCLKTGNDVLCEPIGSGRPRSRPNVPVDV